MRRFRRTDGTVTLWTVERKGSPMGFRRRTRRRALIAGAAIAHHEDRKYAQAQQPAYDEAPPSEASPAYAPPPQYAPPPPSPTDELEHLAQLHTSGALTDEEFAAAKANVLGS
jgi:Short C-terminal domain